MTRTVCDCCGENTTEYTIRLGYVYDDGCASMLSHVTVNELSRAIRLCKKCRELALAQLQLIAERYRCVERLEAVFAKQTVSDEVREGEQL